MKLQRLHIKNFKSIVDLEIVEPNPFTVFVGPNGSGKSNIFEALDIYANYNFKHWERFWGDKDELLNVFSNLDYFEITHSLQDSIGEKQSWTSKYSFGSNATNVKETSPANSEWSDRNAPVDNFYLTRCSRINLSSRRWKEHDYLTSDTLSSSTSNLEKVLKRILLDEVKREEIKEWLDLFIPGFDNIEIVSSELSSTDTLVMYEKGIKKPFTKDLLSDGTYNILALLTAIYQSNEPQFLCIEEPENGLHPKVIKELVHFFRDACEEKGHYIWLNTHSQTLVSQLKPEEIILVNKKKGETITKQLKNHNMHGLRMDEAWLTAALGGGLPW